MITEFIDIKEVNRKLEDNNVKLMLDNESAYRSQLFTLVNTALKPRRKQKLFYLQDQVVQEKLQLLTF